MAWLGTEGHEMGIWGLELTGPPFPNHKQVGPSFPIFSKEPFGKLGETELTFLRTQQGLSLGLRVEVRADPF